MDDGAIASILLETTRSSDACERLVQRAFDAGGRDNVTVIVAAYQIPEEAARPKDVSERTIANFPIDKRNESV